MSMKDTREFDVLDLTQEERSILKGIVDTALTARSLTGRARVSLSRLSQREREILQKASRLLESRQGVSALKMPASQLTLLEDLAQESARYLEDYSRVVKRAERGIGAAVAKAARGTQRLISPLRSVIEKQFPQVSDDPNLATSLSKEMKDLSKRIKSFRENLEVQIRFREEPRQGTKKSTRK